MNIKKMDKDEVKEFNKRMKKAGLKHEAVENDKNSQALEAALSEINPVINWQILDNMTK
jgi:hypothetical protein